MIHFCQAILRLYYCCFYLLFPLFHYCCLLWSRCIRCFKLVIHVTVYLWCHPFGCMHIFILHIVSLSNFRFWARMEIVSQCWTRSMKIIFSVCWIVMRNLAIIALRINVILGLISSLRHVVIVIMFYYGLMIQKSFVARLRYLVSFKGAEGTSPSELVAQLVSKF